MNLSFSKPKGFSERVLLVQARFKANSVPDLVGFDVPNVPSWCFRKSHGDKFHTAPMFDSNSIYRGLIKDGYWEFIVQSNGVSVEENPISLKELKEMLTSSILVPLQ